MGTFIQPDDMTGFLGNSGLDNSVIEEMIADAEALAVVVAPCLLDSEFTDNAAVKAILRGAISRWSSSVTGGVSAVTAGPFTSSFDTRSERRGVFWPSEIQQLQNLCRTTGAGTTSLARPEPPPGEWTGPDQWRPYRV